MGTDVQTTSEPLLLDAQTASHWNRGALSWNGPYAQMGRERIAGPDSKEPLAMSASGRTSDQALNVQV